MNRITGMVAMAPGLLVLGQPALAQQSLPTSVDRSPAFVVQNRTASAQNHCKDAKGNLSEFWGGGDNSSGTLRNGGWLNGPRLVVFNSPGFPTPVPTAFTFTGAFTLTTRKGQLKGTRLFVYDNGPGWGMDMTIIDPEASTGIFAGATGVLYVNQMVSNTSPPPTSYESEVRALICFTASTRLPNDGRQEE